MQRFRLQWQGSARYIFDWRYVMNSTRILWRQSGHFLHRHLHGWWRRGRRRSMHDCGCCCRHRSRRRWCGLHCCRRFCGQLGRGCQRSATAAALAHDDAQLVLFFVVHKQLARHIALVAEHVDQKSHRAQAAAQFFKNRRAAFFLNLAQHQALDRIAHALHGGRGLVKAQHHEHAAHLRHLARHRCQHGGIRRVAEVLVQMLFGFTQCHAQLAHHRPHGLLVAGLTVQLFHPRFERLRWRTVQGSIEALHQHRRLFRLRIFVMPACHERGLQIQHCGGDFHGQLSRWWLANAVHCFSHANQRPRQTMAGGLQLDQRLCDLSELLGHGANLALLATSHGRPCFRRCSNALARLHQH